MSDLSNGLAPIPLTLKPVVQNPFWNCSQTVGDWWKCQPSTFDETFSGFECMPWAIYSFRQSPKWVNADWTQYVQSLSGLIDHHCGDDHVDFSRMKIRITDVSLKHYLTLVRLHIIQDCGSEIFIRHFFFSFTCLSPNPKPQFKIGGARQVVMTLFFRDQLNCKWQVTRHITLFNRS